MSTHAPARARKPLHSEQEATIRELRYGLKLAQELAAAVRSGAQGVIRVREATFTAWLNQTR